jgi:hypothetical protein
MKSKSSIPGDNRKSGMVSSGTEAWGRENGKKQEAYRAVFKFLCHCPRAVHSIERFVANGFIGTGFYAFHGVGTPMARPLWMPVKTDAGTRLLHEFEFQAPA